jgi:hypothetical protein
MACQITFKELFVQLNNMQFGRLIDFGIQIAERTARPEDAPFIERMKRLNKEEFWPGRGFDILTDFPDRTEQKFWCRVFFDTSRAIFDRQVGKHEHSFWQAQAIHQAHATALLFQEAVREGELQWSADTMDCREFDRVVNQKVL